jgi:hypothetical protein
MAIFITEIIITRNYEIKKRKKERKNENNKKENYFS